MGVTSDRKDPDLKYGVDKEQTPQSKKYLVLSESERDKGYVRPYRDSYVHRKCGVETKMNRAIAETYAREPKFYGATYCMKCRMHLPLSEFVWSGTDDVVGG